MKKLVCLLILSIITSCTSKSEETILFSSNRNGNSDIFLMDIDGSNVRTIVNSKNEEWGGVFIDEDNISFMRQIKDSVFRYEMNLTTKKEKRIKNLPGCYLDDKNVVYSKYGDYAFSCNLGLFIKRKNDPKFKLLNTGNRNTPNYLAWSFDGESILYTDDLSGSNNVYKIDINTQKIDNLTNSDANDERGDVSPNGKYLVFSSNRHDKDDQDLFVLNLENGKVENITNSTGFDLIGRWSKDGRYIFYGSNKDNNWEIYRYSISDKSTIRLTNNTFFDGDPRVR